LSSHSGSTIIPAGIVSTIKTARSVSPHLKPLGQPRVVSTFVGPAIRVDVARRSLTPTRQTTPVCGAFRSSSQRRLRSHLGATVGASSTPHVATTTVGTTSTRVAVTTSAAAPSPRIGVHCISNTRSCSAARRLTGGVSLTSTSSTAAGSNHAVVNGLTHLEGDHVTDHSDISGVEEDDPWGSEGDLATPRQRQENGSVEVQPSGEARDTDSDRWEPGSPSVSSR
jgi:hypothetical protein